MNILRILYETFWNFNSAVIRLDYIPQRLRKYLKCHLSMILINLNIQWVLAIETDRYQERNKECNEIKSCKLRGWKARKIGSDKWKAFRGSDVSIIGKEKPNIELPGCKVWRKSGEEWDSNKMSTVSSLIQFIREGVAEDNIDEGIEKETRERRIWLNGNPWWNFDKGC